MAAKGYVQVYTGAGKGKTTAALGLALRVLGAGKKVMILQFMKEQVYSEHKMLADISENLTIETIGKPFFLIKEGRMSEEELAKWKDKAVVFPPGKPPQEYSDLVAQGMARAKDVVAGGEYDLVILDEINVALYFGLVSWKEVEDLIKSKREGVELVLTGRGAPPELIARADLVTEMREIKHYYTQGVEARIGIEN